MIINNMLGLKIKNDSMVMYLLKNSVFTKVQLDTYLINNMTVGKQISLNAKIAMRDKKKISKSSFLRTLKQAQKNLQKSVYSLILAEYLGLLEEGSIIKLIQIGNLLKNINGQISDKNKLKIYKIIESVVEIMSRKRNIK